MLSNYPNGFTSGITIRGVPVTMAYPGKVWWVDGSSITPVNGAVGGQDGGPGTFQRPFATIDYAIGNCVSGRGDIILVKAGHTETLSSATALVADVANVAVIGLGTGSARPTLTFDTADTATINVSAANFTFKNIAFVANFLGIASAITIGAAPHCTIEDCDFSDTSAILNFLACVTTTVSVNADYLTLNRNRMYSIATTRGVAPVVILGTMTGLTATYNHVICTVAHNNVSQFISHAALVMTDLNVSYNFLYSVNTDTATGAILISTTAITGSGIVAHNRIRALDVAAAIIVTATAVQYGMFDNLYIGDGTMNSGFVLPAIGSDA